jgi:hypothetical protein
MSLFVTKEMRASPRQERTKEQHPIVIGLSAWSQTCGGPQLLINETLSPYVRAAWIRCVAGLNELLPTHRKDSAKVCLTCCENYKE